MSDFGNLTKNSAGQPRLRHEFVGMMFALAIGEVGLQTAALVQVGHFFQFLPAYTHLVLATVVISTSWVGWSLSVAPGGRADVRRIFQWEFLVLLLDVILVIVYFILVRTIDFSQAGHLRIDPASKVAALVFVIFALYLVWDLISKVLVSLKNKEPDWQRNYGSRIIPTVICLGIAWAVWQSATTSGASHELSVDFALLCLILLFRALKDLVSAVLSNKSIDGTEEKSLWAPLAWSAVLTLGVVVGVLATRYSWPIPTPTGNLTETKRSHLSSGKAPQKTSPRVNRHE